MENDSAQHATMAMHMVQSGDYLRIFKGGVPYLDKPHMHFWLSALSFKVFGFEVWAYRIPSVLLTIFAGLAVYNLANLIYKKREVAAFAALVFLTTQATMLSLHDVRTDAVLTAFTILAICKWSKFLLNNSLKGAILGAVFTAFAYSTKGLIAIAVIGLFLFFVVVIQNLWKRLLSYKFLIGLAFFVIACFPMLYAYYVQFGLEGIEFITYGQSTGRFSGEDFGGASQNDYFFYFHTLLWAFLPWGIWFYLATYYNFKDKIYNKNLLSLAPMFTVYAFLIVMNFSKFKLPHYLNIILPLASIFLANIVHYIFEKQNFKSIKLFQISANLTVIIGLLILIFLAVIIFPVDDLYIIYLLLIMIVLLTYFFLKAVSNFDRVILSVVGFVMLLNVYLNAMFYSKLIDYQSGTQLGIVAEQNKISPENIFMLDGQYSWAMDWYIKGTTQKIESKDLSKMKKPFWLMVRSNNPLKFQPDGFKIKKSYRANDFAVTRLSLDFLFPSTRKEELYDAWLIQFVPK